MARNPPHVERRTRTESPLLGRGVAAGIAGAVAMGLIATFVSAISGTGFFTPAMLVGATYLGVDWSAAPAWAAVLGVVTHLAVGAAFGALFVALARNITSISAKFAAGVAYGAAVYLFMTFLLMPWANPVMYASIDKGSFFLLHLAYGAALPFALLRERPTFVPRRRHAV